ncbi:MAG: hypothetical protein AAGH99_14080 [Planctomycetota bacterium]
MADHPIEKSTVKAPKAQEKQVATSPPAPKMYHQRLPAWIHTDVGQRKVGRTYLSTLQFAANAGDRDQQGNIIDIWGGSRLAKRAGISARTLQRHIPVLIANGYLVITRLGDSYNEDPTKYTHIYAIPHKPGGLDPIALPRPSGIVQIPVAGEYDQKDRQKYRPMHIKAGGQCSMWTEEKRRQESLEQDQPTVHKDYSPAPASEQQAERDQEILDAKSVTPPTSHRRNPLRQPDVFIPSPSPSPFVKQNHDHEGEISKSIAPRHTCSLNSPKKTKPHKPWLTGVHVSDLNSIPSLLNHLQRAVELKLGGLKSVNNEGDQLKIVAMAVHAQRKGKKPANLFASNISQAGQNPFLWRNITQEDEDEARRRLKDYRYIDTSHLRTPPIASGSPPAKLKFRDLSENAKRVLAALHATRCDAGEEIEAWRALRGQHPKMRREEFEAGLCEVRKACLYPQM